MKCDLIIAGVGGQGILTLAGLIAQSALRAGLNVKQSEVHGMAQRGGAVEAHLRLSSATIFSDLAPGGAVDVLCGMEPLETLRHLHSLAPTGWVVTGSEAVENIPDYPPLADVLKAIREWPRHLLFPAIQLAQEAGSPRASNMVLLGAVSALLPLPEEVFAEVITELFQAKGAAVADVNRKAFACGRELASRLSDLPVVAYWTG